MDALYYTLFAWFAPALYVFPIIFASGFDFRLFWRLVCWFRKVKLFRYAELASFYQFLTLWPNLLIWLSWLTLINCGETQIFCFILLSETLFRRFAHLLFKHPPTTFWSFRFTPWLKNVAFLFRHIAISKSIGYWSPLNMINWLLKRFSCIYSLPISAILPTVRKISSPFKTGMMPTVNARWRPPVRVNSLYSSKCHRVKKVKMSLTFLDFAIMAMNLFPDEFTGTFPQETLDGGFRKANPFADTYRFGGGKRGRQEG